MNLTTIHPNPKYTNPHENRDRLNSRKNSRKPGVDRSPRPTQKRPPPANPTLPGTVTPKATTLATARDKPRDLHPGGAREKVA